MQRSALMVVTLVLTAFVSVYAQTNFDDGFSVVLDCRASGMHGTGVTFESGDSVVVFARGLYRYQLGSGNTDNWTGPNGNGYAPSSNMPCQTAAALAVIGSIGDDPVFAVGSCRTFIADTGGEFKIGINENLYSDNEGYCVVTILKCGRVGASVPFDQKASWSGEQKLFVEPNPSRLGATISYTLEGQSGVSVGIYDVSGRLVDTLFDGFQPVGEHSIRWDGTNADGAQVAPGAYYVILRTDGGSMTRKVVHLR